MLWVNRRGVGEAGPLRIVALCAFMFACAHGPKVPEVPLSEADRAVLAKDVLEFANKELPPAKTTLLFDASREDALTCTMEATLAKAGYGVAHLSEENKGKGLIVRAGFHPVADSYVLRVSLGDLEVCRWYYRSPSGLETQAPRMVRRRGS